MMWVTLHVLTLSRYVRANRSFRCLFSFQLFKRPLMGDKPCGVNLRKGKVLLLIVLQLISKVWRSKYFLQHSKRISCSLSMLKFREFAMHCTYYILTFRRECAVYWTQHRPRHPGMTTLILAMICRLFTDASKSCIEACHRGGLRHVWRNRPRRSQIYLANITRKADQRNTKKEIMD